MDDEDEPKKEMGCAGNAVVLQHCRRPGVYLYLFWCGLEYPRVEQEAGDMSVHAIVRRLLAQ